MLDGYIIDAIREQRRERETDRRVRLELPDPRRQPEPLPPTEPEAEDSWEPIVIPLYPEEDAA